MIEEWVIDKLNPLKGEKLIILADPQRMIRSGAQAVDGWAKVHGFTVLFCSGNLALREMYENLRALQDMQCMSCRTYVLSDYADLQVDLLADVGEADAQLHQEVAEPGDQALLQLALTGARCQRQESDAVRILNAWRARSESGAGSVRSKFVSARPCRR
jgi:hypothetical protein